MTVRLEKCKTPSEHIRKRSAKMSVAEPPTFHFDFEKAIDVRVEPDEPEKGKVAHTVHFEQKNVPGENLIVITCFETESLRNCIANKYGTHCSHVNAAIEYLIEQHSKGAQQL